MKNSFLSIVSIIQAKEWKELKKFILMDHGEETDLVKLFNKYESYKNKLASIPGTEKLIAQYFPAMTKKGFLNLNSRLFQVTEDWFAFRQLSNNVDQKEILLNKTYNDNGLYKLADQKANKLIKKWENAAQLSSINDTYKSQLLHQQYYSDNPIKYAKDSTLLEELVISQLANIKLKGLIYELELHNWGLLKQIDYSYHLDILHSVNEKLPDSALSEILLDLAKVVSQLDLEAFLKVKALLLNDTFEKNSELHTLITMYLINAGIKLWENGKYTNAQESARLIEYGLRSEVLMKSGKIPWRRFFNLIATLGKLKSFDWTQEFIERWYQNVETENLIYTKSLAEALNAFGFQKYELIIPLIRGIEFQDFIEKLRALGLEVIALYIDRKDNYNLLRNNISNFKRTLKRNEGKLSTPTIKSYVNFLKVLELLIQRDFRKITIHLEKYDALIYRGWLFTQVQNK